MHERRRSKSRSIDEATTQRERGCTNWSIVRRRQPHDQIVRVLIIDERCLVECFAGLKGLRRAELAKREGFKREHAVKTERATTGLVREDTHQPVLRFEVMEVPELADLEIANQEHRRVDRPRPACVVCGLMMFVLSIRWRGEKQQDDQAKRRGRRSQLHVSDFSPGMITYRACDAS